MARIQTRRAVSLNRQTYDEAKLLASEAGVPLARYVDLALWSYAHTKEACELIRRAAKELGLRESGK